MTYQFRPAVRENVGLLLSLAGGTGSGKTYTALRLATGLSGGKPFGVIDTEAGRAKHYANDFRFHHCDMTPPFSPDAYAEAIKAADDAKYPVIVVDSASHEHAGDGGLLDWHERELQRMAGDDWKRREACNMAAWIKPKTAHKAMVSRLLQVRAHLILCFRAEEKVEMVSDREVLEQELLSYRAKSPPGDRTQYEADLERRISESDKKKRIIPKRTRTGKDGWVPICEKNLPFEMTASFLLTDDAPGVPKPIKLEAQHRAFFPTDKPITEDAGRALAEWAAGGKAPDELSNSDIAALKAEMDSAAKRGVAALRSAWSALKPAEQRAMESFKDALKAAAAAQPEVTS